MTVERRRTVHGLPVVGRRRQLFVPGDFCLRAFMQDHHAADQLEERCHWRCRGAGTTIGLAKIGATNGDLLTTNHDHQTFHFLFKKFSENACVDEKVLLHLLHSCSTFLQLFIRFTVYKFLLLSSLPACASPPRALRSAQFRAELVVGRGGPILLYVCTCVFTSCGIFFGPFCANTV